MTIGEDIRLQGALVRLRERTHEDVPDFLRWYSDPDVRHWLHISEAPPPTYDSERTRYEMSHRDPARIDWIIETIDGTPIGNLALVDINQAHRRAELGISIGEQAYWGRGYGTEAIRLVLRYAFEELRLHRVELITDADNERATRCYEKCGFVREGVLRDKRQRYGLPIDMLVMSVLAPDWPQRHTEEHRD